MSDAWKDMKKAKEEEFFQRQNQLALERLRARKTDKPRLSPISGKAMVQKTIHGVVVDVCQESGGIFLDAGELEQIIKAITDDKKDNSGFLHDFFKNILPSR